MRTSSSAAWVVAALAAVLAFAPARVAHADSKADIAAKAKQAMESYDMMDYDAARKLLNQAVALAKKGKLDKDPVVAKVYLDLGIVAFAVPDQDAAKVAFQSAVQIDSKIQIDAAYRSADMVKLLDEARTEAGGGGTGGGTTAGTGGGTGIPSLDGTGPAGADCSAVTGLQHNIIDNAKIGASVTVKALLGSDVAAAKVSLWYRPEGAQDFIEVKMKSAGCEYSAAIPGTGTKGSVVHYYVAAYDGANKVLAEKGSAGSPNIIELAAGAGGGGPGEDEDPLHKGGGGDNSGGDVTQHADSPSGPSKFFIGVVGGTGFGYVRGTTEGGNAVKNCCIGNSLLVVTPELGIMIGKQLSIGGAVRLGVPIGADFDGHATLAPSGLLRVRYALADNGEGVRVMGQAGFGILRNTLKIDNPKNAMETTDIVAQGPLLIGGGIGYTKHLSSAVAFIFDVSALAGIAVTSSFGSAPALNSGVSADVSLGLAVGM
jgi:hypothetical protein|nr:tetratricopeptide repeat protein [Kofleriaceae bacterium]